MKYYVYNLKEDKVIKSPLGSGLTSNYLEGQEFTEAQAKEFIKDEEFLMLMKAHTENSIESLLEAPTEEEMQKLMNALSDNPLAFLTDEDPISFDSHPFMDQESSRKYPDGQWNVEEHVKPMYDCEPESINTPYDPDGTGKPKKNNVKLIKKVLKKTAAISAGGLKMQVEDDRVILYSNGQLDFYAVGIFDSLGIFDVKITCDRKHRVLVIVS